MAKDFRVSVPHSLSQADARRRIDLLVAQTRSVLADGSRGDKVTWQDHECHFRLKVGIFPLSGVVTVGGSTVDVRGRLPWGAGRYAGRVQEVVAERLRALLTDGGAAARARMHQADDEPPPPPLRRIK